VRARANLSRSRVTPTKPLLRGVVAAALVVGLVTADLAVGGAQARSDQLLTDPLDGIRGSLWSI